jgi:hypothetical protein
MSTFNNFDPNLTCSVTVSLRQVGVYPKQTSVA